MRKLAKAAAVLLVFVMVLGLAPFGRVPVQASFWEWLFGGDAEKIDVSELDLTPLKKYEEPVVMSVARMTNADAFAPGDSEFDNGWLRLIKEKLNIEIDAENSFAVNSIDYNTVLALRISSGTLPDTFGITPDSVGMSVFKQLLDYDMLADLTEIYKQAIGGKTKAALADVDTAELNKYMTVDGVQYGISSGAEGYNRPFLWIRQDWLDALGLDVPQTIEDIEKVALAFIEEKPGGQENTIGISVGPRQFTDQWMSLDPVFNSFGSYPDQWLTMEDGTAAFGAIQPEAKEALAVLADWYAKGIIPPEFITAANGDEVRAKYLDSSAAGMMFSAWWQPWSFWSDHGEASVNRNQNVDWTPVFAPVNEDGIFEYRNELGTLGGQVVLSTFANPEAVVKAMNLMVEYETFTQDRIPGTSEVAPGEEDAYALLQPMRDADSSTRTNTPFMAGLLPNTEGRLINARAINEYLETDEFNPDPRIPAGDYANIIGAYNFKKNNTLDDWYANPVEENMAPYTEQWVGNKAFDLVGNMFLDFDAYKLVTPAYIGKTASDAKYGALLDDLWKTAFAQIVSGEQPIDYFDEFVERWKSSGGDIITAEVNVAILE